MANISNTQYFKVNTDPEYRVKEILDTVYDAMAEKGYNPVNQIVGYIMSGDPTYITSYKNARSMIMKVERDELVEELLPGNTIKVTIEEIENGERKVTLEDFE